MSRLRGLGKPLRDSDVWVLRAMKTDERGSLKTGWSARTLGVRCNVDIPTDEDGFVLPKDGGMSVSPFPAENLPRIRRPPEYGGIGKDPLWSIDVRGLPRHLVYRPDPDDPETHGFIEPSRRMSLSFYVAWLHETRSWWLRVR